MDTSIDPLVGRAEATIQALARGDDPKQVGVDRVLLDIEAAMKSSPMARARLGPLVGRLRSARKANLEPPAAHWVAVGGGHVAIGPRPKLKGLSALRRHGATHVLTLLSESEGAATIGAAARTAGIEWLWLPLPDGDPPGCERLVEISQMYGSIRNILAAEGRLFVHCAASIHRTGLIVYGLLRSTALTRSAATQVLSSLRAHTSEGVGEVRLAWGDQFGVP